MLLVSDLDDSNMTLACRSCGERAQSDADWKEMHYEWLHCPGCCSGDVNVELSCPYGSVWWSCDDCSYERCRLRRIPRTPNGVTLPRAKDNELPVGADDETEIEGRR